MARAGTTREHVGRIAFRLYLSAYFAVVGFAFVGDLSGEDAKPLMISPRTSALAGLVLVGVIATATLAGRVAVALRPAPAEVQLGLLSPVDRSETLARSISVMGTVAVVAGGFAAVVLMLVATPQFAGLSTWSQLGYVAFAGSAGLVVFSGHLLVAERRWRLQLAASVAVLIVLSVADVARATSVSPASTALQSLRDGRSFLSIVITLVFGLLLLWRATRNAESIELEKISRGGDVGDLAAVALSGNDIRSLLILQRSMTARPWRARPVVRVSSRVARRFPVFVRTLRNVARWRAYRCALVVALSGAIGALMRADPSARTVALAAVTLYALGLTACESFAQEHDRADRLALLPMAYSVEYRQLTSCFTLLFMWLTGVLLIALAGSAGAATTVSLAGACATAATTSSAISARRVSKTLGQNMAINMSAAAGSDIVLTVAWPVLVAFFCVAPWLRHPTPAGLLSTAGVAAACMYVWIRTGDAGRNLVGVFTGPS
jgi:hypothetical protein